ncbi:MAG: hypothetical protein NVS9B15_05590 [Acidobacteriaceae bacterium]
MLALLAAPALIAQNPSVSVRMFWRNPPQEVRIEGIQDASVRTCAVCKLTRLSGARTVRAAAKDALWFSGSYRLEMHARPPVDWSGAAKVESAVDGVNVTLEMPREEYVAAVLAGETTADAPAEFLKAMAVTVRTYALHEQEQHRHIGFDFCDSTHCQDFKLQNRDAKFEAATQATRNSVLWSRGRPAMAYYHQDCGGKTAAGHEAWPEMPAAGYLTSHEDPYCVRATGVRWRAELMKADLAKALAQFPSLHADARFEVAERSASGRVHLLHIGGRPISASSFRFAVDRALGWDQVRSDLYELRDMADRIVLTGRGAGHGVGLCQNGALEMAREGKSYREILAFYYPGLQVGVSAQDVPWQRLQGDRLVLWTTDPRRDGSAVRKIVAIRNDLESASGLRTADVIEVRAYPDVATFRDATGEPGWIAGFVRGSVIHLQPISVLTQKRLLDSTLRHELLHHAIEITANPQAPRWFREGMVEYLTAGTLSGGSGRAPSDAVLLDRSNQNSTRQAYRDAQARVTDLVARYGRERVLGWLRNGIPGDVLRLQ